MTDSISYSFEWTSRPTWTQTRAPADPLLAGLQAHAQGDIDGALAHFLDALRARPQRALASYNLGVALIDAGLGLTSLPFLSRAVLLEPGHEVHGDAYLFGLIRSGQLEAARAFVEEQARLGMASARIAIWTLWLTDAAAEPPTPRPRAPSHEADDRMPALPTQSAAQEALAEDFAACMTDYQELRLHLALERLEALLGTHPQWGEGQHLRGVILMALGENAAATQTLEQATRILSGRAEVWDHLAVAYTRVGDHPRTDQAFQRALALQPLRAETWNNAADTALQQGRFELAYQYALQALRLLPERVESLGTLLTAAVQLDDWLAAQGRAEDGAGAAPTILAHAVAQAKALRVTPEYWLMIAVRLETLRRREWAVAIMEEALTRFENVPPRLFGQLVVGQRHLCDWREWQTRMPRLLELIRHSETLVVSPFAALCLPGLNLADLRRVARMQAANYAPWRAHAQDLRPAPARPPRARLRIGYLSNDFYEHATAYLAAGVFEQHDRERFEVFAYVTNRPDDSPMWRRLARAFEHVVELHDLSYIGAAQRIRDDGIDLLIDVKGYTTGARMEILALRPGAVQVSWLAFPGTLGSDFIDYAIVDPVVVPPSAAGQFDEALAYLPDAYAPVDQYRRVGNRRARATEGLPDEAFVFCCFNNSYKITPEVFACWCDLLLEVPRAVLWLYAANDSGPENLRRAASARGIAPERLVFAAHLPQADHLARLALADLVLDTQPYNAHTTASDALWMGVPVLACMGETFPSRVAASLLTAAGMPELITRDLAEYRDLALRLATHPEELAALRTRLATAHQEAPFFDTQRFARNLEALYARIWQRHEQGLPPTHLPPAAV